MAETRPALHQRVVHVAHDHIPTQVVSRAAEARVVRTDLRPAAATIGYVQGAGDDVAAALGQIGYTVT